MTPGPERRASSQTAKPVWKNPRTILITGATGGIGAALARNYASVGRTLILHGRDQERLAALSEICQARGARVLQMTFDLRDADTAVGELRSISQRESIDLAIVNAGVTKMIGDGEQIVGGLNDSSNAVFGVGSAELYDPVAGRQHLVDRRFDGNPATALHSGGPWRWACASRWRHAKRLRVAGVLPLRVFRGRCSICFTVQSTSGATRSAVCGLVLRVLRVQALS